MDMISSQNVTILVGEERKPVRIQKDILTARCAHFQGLYRNDMHGTQEDTFEWLDEDPDVVDLFVEWVHAQRIGALESDLNVHRYTKAYMLADELCMPQFQNAIMDQLRRPFRTTAVNPGHLAWLEQHAICCLQLHAYFLDQLVYEIHHSTSCYKDGVVRMVDGTEKPTPVKAGLEVLMGKQRNLAMKLFWRVQAFDKVNSQDPSMLEGCHYHVHDEGETCDTRSSKK